jgi:ribosomal-protein-alanine N-acetyltransferase
MSAILSDADLAPQVLEVTAASVEPLAALHAQAFEAPWSAAELARMIDGPCAFALAIGTGAQAADIQGFVVARAIAGEAEILTLAVRPDMRRRGLARSLIAAVCTRAVDHGARVLWLEVAVDNSAALALYQSLGFEAAGRRPAYYGREQGGPVDALVMRRDLNSSVS